MPFGKEFFGPVGQTFQIVLFRTETKPEHFDFRLLGMRLLLLLFLALLIEEMPQITDFYNRRAGFGRHFNQIELLLPRAGDGIGSLECFRRSIITDKENFGNGDLFVDPWAFFVTDGTLISLTQKTWGGTPRL